MLPGRPCAQAIAGDSIPELIALWTAIRDRPERVVAHYAALWRRRQDEGHRVFYAVRERFNARRDALDLFFLTRTCVNGLIRFNARGDFNNSLHHTRAGIHPERLAGVARAWTAALRDVEFRAADYRRTLASARAGDLVFLDPPYVGNKGRYHPARFDFAGFHEELGRLSRVGAHWIVTLDGAAGGRTYASAPPPDLYRARLRVPTGNSPFTRLMKTSLDGVTETVYANFDPAPEALDRGVPNEERPTLADRALVGFGGGGGGAVGDRTPGL